jgi:NAD(P)-dependent dehydrogenase (short-subunit alcohol dehydrogenase family)
LGQPGLPERLQKNPKVHAMISAIVPIKRAVECEEVSDNIAFLCSRAASYINGTSIIIDAAVTTSVRLSNINFRLGLLRLHVRVFERLS